MAREAIRKRAYTQLVTARSGTVVSARWATVSLTGRCTVNSGGFSSLARIVWENVPPFIPRLRVFFLFFFKVEISWRTLIPLFTPGLVHSGSASWGDCSWVCSDELCVSSFPDRFPRYAWTAVESADSDFFGSRVYACLDVTCHLHFWQNDRGLLPVTAVTRGWNEHRITVSTQSWLWRRELSRRSCRIRIRNLSIMNPVQSMVNS